MVALLNPPQSPFELSCATEVFGTAPQDEPPRYHFGICAETPGPLPTTVGYAMVIDAGLEALEQAATVIVPGWQPPGVPAPPAVTSALRAAHRRGARIVAICTGAFVLARAGLLDGRRATTHWRDTARLTAAFPRVHVDQDVLFVDHGDVATSAGTGAGIDLCLHLVRSDHGAAYAAQVARNMVLPPHREGSQLQYAALPAPAKADESLAPLLEWATSRLHIRLTLDRLAERAGLSSRTIARRFTEQLGTSPGQWLLNQRIDAARALLEQTDLPVDAVATRVGLTSTVNLRRRFWARLGTTPGATDAPSAEPDGPRPPLSACRERPDRPCGTLPAARCTRGALRAGGTSPPAHGGGRTHASRPGRGTAGCRGRWPSSGRGCRGPGRRQPFSHDAALRAAIPLYRLGGMQGR